jgi:hypothetical protein
MIPNKKEIGILNKYQSLLNKIPADYYEFYASLEVDENLSATEIGRFTILFQELNIAPTNLDYYCKGYLSGALDSATTTLMIPDQVTTIGEQCFLDNIYIKSIVFSPNSKCRHIHRRAFEGCKDLRGVILPKSLVGMGKEVFIGCSSLIILGYAGTKKDWKNLHLATNWQRGSSIEKIICADGEIELI